ncbi:histone H1 [Melioribacteraceae bacterium 4301-Me]|uniref:histone H1 n=1 Tax=Pyranulibacter aquaticus TaxID=3163344 RepID=UPI00359A6523
MSQKYQQLVEYLKSLEVDVQKFYEKGQAAAGTRLRKGLSELKRMAQEIRNEVQEIKAQRKNQKSSSGEN